MNLRNVDEYNIGIDLGTGSVGWAVLDSAGYLLHFKGKPTFGSRVFSGADTAASARTPRGQRRRYIRRRQRLNLLQDLFKEQIGEVDPDFFVRLNQSRLLPEDRKEGATPYHWPFFNSSDFTEPAYYEKFPTIYHLRTWLMNTDDKADIRLIYLAFHNIVKTRGNFLHEDEKNLSAKNANVGGAVKRFCEALEEWCASQGISNSCMDNAEKITDILMDTTSKKGDKRESLIPLFALGADYKKTSKALGQAITGYIADFSSIFFIEGESIKFALNNDEKVEEFSSLCPDEGANLFESIKALYSSFVLSGILRDSEGGTLSGCKVKEYEQYKKDLVCLKALVRKYVPDKYDQFFRGEFYEGTNIYDPAKSKGYTKYNSTRGTAYDDFKKSVISLFKGTPAESDEQYKDMVSRFEEERFLRRLKTSDNGSIPYQLHLEEMDAIIENQGKYYSFLIEEKEKLESLVSFRIPYYIGPLTTKNAPVDSHGKKRFAWSKKLPGKEDCPIMPWNWESIIDKHASAQAFIERMTGLCTYLEGEPVLPKSSLLYEEFCVLNELNGAHFTQDGDREYRFDYRDRIGIINDLFKKKRGRVTYKDVSDWMSRERGFHNVKVSGGQGEKGFESRLTSYAFFCHDIFGVEELSQKDYPMIEELIHWSTLFEDRNILREELEGKYGERLNGEQIKLICKKRFTGWGRLSRKLLTGIKAQTDEGPMSIMEIMREGSPTSGEKARAMVLMEILRDKNLDFSVLIENANREYLLNNNDLDINSLPGSPAIRRSINQAVRIIEEIAGIVGHAPSNIFIEVTRDDQEDKKGTRTTRRYDRLKTALDSLKETSPELWSKQVDKELRGIDAKNLDERLSLYFMQGGRSLYSGKELDIGRLSDYHVDHIIPQSYIKDDSLENKALVLAQENEAKSDAMLIDESIRRKMKSEWKALYDAGLIGPKKYNNLMRSSLSEEKLKGFIARQLVETSQSVKLLQMLLSEKYPETNIVPIKAALSSSLRAKHGYVKCREINDYHHAHDALLACEIGRFILYRFPDMHSQPVKYAKVMKSLARGKEEQSRRNGRQLGSAGFIVESFGTSGFDEETGEIFKDEWDAEFEIERIRKYLNYKDCFISKMPEITGGQFWDATIYSPRDPKKKGSLNLPLKEGLNPEKYGSYSREQFAYFFIYEASKTGKKVYEFAPVPLRIASRVETAPEQLEEYAKKHARENRLEFIRIVRPCVYKQQLIEMDGNRFFITGQREVRNGIQPAFNQSVTAIIKALLDGDETTNSERLEAYSSISRYMRHKAPKLASQLNIERISAEFDELAAQEQISVIKELLSISSAKKNMIDLTCVGGSKYSGCMNISYSKELSSSDVAIYFIDQSVTGMFERKTRIGL